ncbi:Rhomboid protease GlpG [invertebrate metagenome]|uniref:Rhomboid protease GlpG n=1 Tax=invertebrate metagenome TaxID=1711999 RepID=A0A2H9T587_9ZZZZ
MTSVIKAMSVPVGMDLRPLLRYLGNRGIPLRVTEESGQQVIWTVSHDDAAIIIHYYDQWQNGVLIFDEDTPNHPKWSPGQLISGFSFFTCPVTLFFIVASIVVTLVTGLGQSLSMVSYLTFVPFDIVNDQYLRFWSLVSVWAEGEYWRLITPVFLHFSWLHLVFNMLWLFDIGQRIETRFKGWHLFLLILVTGVVSNFSQYYWGDAASIFGGFSGVVYGLLGYCMVRERMDKLIDFGILPAIYGFMLIFLVLGYTGIFTAVFGSLANSAHTGGLLSGMVIGGLAGVFCRKNS